MPPSWRDGLVNAFPIPKDRMKPKLASKKSTQETSTQTVEGETNDEIDLSTPISPFRFFELPAEVRNEIYALLLFSSAGYRRSDGTKKSRTSILAVSKRAHLEATYVLYTSSTFKIFPIQDFVQEPLVQELRPIYRSMVTKVEMLVGSSWTSPPKSWRVSKLLAKRLSRLTSLQTLKVFVEVDPSEPDFEKYRISLDFYTDFCGDLFRDLLVALPLVKFVEVNGNPGVNTRGPLVTRLVKEAEAKGKMLTLGPTKPMLAPGGVQLAFWS